MAMIVSGQKPLVIISGPTATGKSDLAIEVAQFIEGEIINFDSLLFYQDMDVGVAKPSSEQMQLVPHHLVGFQNPKSPLNAAHYCEVARPKIQETLNNNKIPILVGGSGFYLQALLMGMYDSPTTSENIRRRSDELYHSSGIDPFLDILQRHDQESFRTIHPNDHYRIRRATEHFWSHGTKFSCAAKTLSTPYFQQEKLSPIHCYLDIDKKDHWKIIEQRTDGMLQNGLIEEVKFLIEKYGTNPKPFQSIGYKQVLSYLSHEITNLETCREKIIIATRQLAKSQRTWFNRKKDKKQFHPLDQRGEILQWIQNGLTQIEMTNHE